MKNTSVFEPKRSPGISETTKNPEARNQEKATNSIEGIGYEFLNTVTPQLLFGIELIFK